MFFEIAIFASDVFVSKNRPKGHGICLFLVMGSHEMSWNMNFQKEYEPWHSYGELNCDRLHNYYNYFHLQVYHYSLLASTHKPVLAWAPSSSP